jgi:hypothetical protein
MVRRGSTARKTEQNTVGMFQYIVMSAADTNGPSTMAGVNAMDIITATRKSARRYAISMGTRNILTSIQRKKGKPTC